MCGNSTSILLACPVSGGGAALQWPTTPCHPSWPPSYFRGVVQVQNLLPNSLFLYGILVGLICPRCCASLSFPSQCLLLHFLLLDQKTCS